MKRPDHSIFELRKPALWRSVGGNLLLWALAVGFWWRSLQIHDVASIPSSHRRGVLTVEIATLLALVFLGCAFWAVYLVIKKNHWRHWSFADRVGLSGLIASLLACGGAMAYAAYRIAEVGSAG